MSATNLRLFRQFYLLYPQIHQTLSVEFENIGYQIFVDSPVCKPPEIGHPAGDLLDRLSFSHFIELFKANSDASRFFYEAVILRNSWSVRELQRVMSSLLFERTGLSEHREIRCEQTNVDTLVPAQFFRDPYLLEFLQLEEKAQYTECDLEAAIIGHLQSFLLEPGKGFCFEARQKRITFDNTHYRIDLVFYHRILKCHVLVDLKLGDFSHADAGQMNVYLNYYRENEFVSGDNPPIGIILCSGKNEALVRYATAGLAHKLFVSKYLINLPSEVELERILKEERGKVQKQKRRLVRPSLLFCTAYGSRTRHSSVKGRRLSRLTNAASLFIWDGKGRCFLYISKNILKKAENYTLRCLAPHAEISRSMGSVDLPKSVNAYSTRGGTSGNTVRSTSPSPSSSRNCATSIRSEIPGMSFRNSLYRFLPSVRLNNIEGFHRPPITDRACDMPHNRFNRVSLRLFVEFSLRILT